MEISGLASSPQRRAISPSPRSGGNVLRSLCCIGVACLVGGCADARRSEPAAGGGGPAAEFFSLEERLLAADRVRLEFLVTAEGAVEASLQGTLSIGPDGEAELVASGRFAGEPVDLLLRSDRSRVELGNGPNIRRAATPASLNEAILIGMTRMGILHNLARLTGAAAPDHAEGGVRDWVSAGPFALDDDALSFDLTVAGEPAGAAALVIDAAGLPTLRRQTVEFPSGQMRVVERYSGFAISE